MAQIALCLSDCARIEFTVIYINFFKFIIELFHGESRARGNHERSDEHHQQQSTEQLNFSHILFSPYLSRDENETLSSISGTSSKQFLQRFSFKFVFFVHPKNKPHRVYNGAFAMILQEKNADTSVMSSKEIISCN
jgi:hypothetical protein